MSVGSYPVVRSQRQAKIIVAAQLAATLIVAVVSGLLADSRAAWSAATGGGIGVVATAYMAFAVLRHRPGTVTPAVQVMGRFVLGWIIKVMLTIGLLVVAFGNPALRPLPVLLAFVVVNVVYWVAAFKTSSPG